MLARTHVWVAAGGLAAYGAVSGHSLGWAGWLAATIGALLPDVDHAQSTFSKSAGRGWAPGVRHRSGTHTLLAWVIVSAVAGMALGFRNPLAWAFCWGYLSHLLADLPSGKVPLLWPVVRRRFGLSLIRTGGPLEFLLRYTVIAVVIFLQAKSYFPSVAAPALLALSVVGIRATRQLPKAL